MKNVCIVFALLCLTIGSAGRANLSALPELKPYRALRVSSYDRSGGNADGQNILPQPGETATLADLRGPGEVTHIWVTIASPEPDHLRRLVLRMYWDGEEHPSVEAPIGDFFGLGHAQYYHFSSQPIAIGTNNGMNCFWLMPFSKSARITLTHEGKQPLHAFYYYVDYRVYPESDANAEKTIAAKGRFHAQYRQLMPTLKGEDYTLLEAQGQGHYVGCSLSIQLNSDGWWGEGDDKIYVDGESFPSLHGTGSEDYFCGAWCYGDAFSTPYFGCPLRGRHAKSERWNVYRYHIEDPIPFTRSIRVDIEAIHQSRPEDPPDDYSSVAYWYQAEPHRPFPALPPVDKRMPQPVLEPFAIKGLIEAESMPIVESDPPDLESRVQDMGNFGSGWSGSAQLWILAREEGASLSVELEVAQSGTYRIEGYFTKSWDYGQIDVSLDGKRITRVPIDGYYASAVPTGMIDLGTRKLRKGPHTLRFTVVGKNEKSSGFLVGVDGIRLEKVK